MDLLMIVQVKKTYPNDFERIYPLLEEFRSSYTKEDWKKIFLYQWEGVEDYVGFHLENENVMVGFMGLIFSVRHKNNDVYKFCNITSLIVQENYRTFAFLLLRKLRTLENTTCIAFNPICESYNLLTRLGFANLEKHYRVIPTINFLWGPREVTKIYEPPVLLEKVNGEEKRIVSDHVRLKCSSILFESMGRFCLIIYKIITQGHKILRNKIHILYVNDVSLFNEIIFSILGVFNKKYGFCSALYIDDRFIQNQKKIFSISREIKPPGIYSGFRDKLEIDQLYSEIVLL